VKMELDTVPLVGLGENFNYNMEELLEKARGKYPLSNRNREGIVVRAMYGAFSKKMRNRISFKVVNNDFLLREKE